MLTFTGLACRFCGSLDTKMIESGARLFCTRCHSRWTRASYVVAQKQAADPVKPLRLAA